MEGMEILAPEAAPLGGSLGQRVARELRQNPWAVVGVLLSGAAHAGRQALLALSHRLPRLSSAFALGSRRLGSLTRKAPRPA